MNKILPNVVDTQSKDVSIVEIGVMGNVLREFYRISLEDGAAWDVTNGQTVSSAPNGACRNSIRSTPQTRSPAIDAGLHIIATSLWARFAA